MTKRIIKQLASDINEVLERNYISNEMSYAVDYGEWGQSEPDFSTVIEKWKLDRYKLNSFVDLALNLCNKFNESYKKTLTQKFKPNYKRGIFSIEDVNPWQRVIETLHCIYMVNSFEDDEDFTDPAGGHGLHSHI